MASDPSDSFRIRYTHDGFVTSVAGRKSAASRHILRVALALPPLWVLSSVLLIGFLGVEYGWPLVLLTALSSLVGGMVYIMARATARTEVSVGLLGITIEAQGQSTLLPAADCVHAENRNDHLILTTRSCDHHEVPAHAHTEDERRWMVEQLRTRIDSWNSPTGTVPQAMQGLRGRQTE